MKNITFSKLFILSVLIFSQFNYLTAQTTTMRDVLNTAFANIDKTRVPTKYLKEFGFNFLDMGMSEGNLILNNLKNPI